MSNCIHGLAQGECTFCKEKTVFRHTYFQPQLISKINNNDPLFTYEYSTYKGNSIMEILKNEEAFWEDLPGAKRNFRFGLEKAYMILNCMPIIQEFHQSDGRIPNKVIQFQNTDKKYSLRCRMRRLYWKGHPYLKIEACKTLNFGLLKSKAIIELEHEIKMFCDRGVW